MIKLISLFHYSTLTRLFKGIKYIKLRPLKGLVLVSKVSLNLELEYSTFSVKYQSKVYDF